MLSFLTYKLATRLATYALVAAFLSAMAGPIQANVDKVRGALVDIQAVAQ